jgi:hypothetical protein
MTPANDPPKIDIEDLRDVEDAEVELDVLGQVEVGDQLRTLVMKEVEGDLSYRWPMAGPEQLSRAVADVVDFRLHTLETGGINYSRARDLGHNLVKFLGQPEH